MSVQLRDPLGELLSHYKTVREPAAKLLELLTIIDFAFRVDALLLLAVYLRDPGPADERITRILKSEELGAGSWLFLLETLLSIGDERHVAELRSWLMRHQQTDCFKRLVNFRNAYAHCKGSRLVSDLEREIESVERELHSCLGDHPTLGALDADEHAVRLSLGGMVVELSPLLLPGALVGAAGSLLCMSRRCDQLGVLRYLHPLAGEQLLAQDERGYGELQSLLRGKSGGIDTMAKRAKDGEQATTLQRCFASYSERTLLRLSARHVYREESFIERVEANATLHAFIGGSSRLLVVVGPEGAGKSSFLADLARRSLAEANSVLFFSGDRLSSPSFPEALGPPLELSGLAGKLSQAAVVSQNARMLVIVDDVVTASGKGKLLDSMLGFIEGAQARSPVRLVVSMQSAQLAAFRAHHPGALDSDHVTVLQLPQFSAHEVRLLAAQLPLPLDSRRLLEARQKATACILRSDDETARRPGLLVRILESEDPSAISQWSVSASTIRAEQFRVACPDRSQRKLLAKQLASIMLEQGTLSLDVESPQLLATRLFYEENGALTPDYSTLLALGFVVETTGRDGTQVAFANGTMFTVSAAQRYLTGDLVAALEELYLRSSSFDPALEIAAQVAVCQQHKLADGADLSGLTMPSAVRQRLLRMVADLDRTALLALITPLLGDDPGALLALFGTVLADGQPRTAELGLARLIASGRCTPALLHAARLLRCEALYIMDEYDEVDGELLAISTRDAATDKMRAMIAAARGDFQGARDFLARLLDEREAGSAQQAEALMWTSYALRGLGQYIEAETCIRDAIALMEQLGDDRYRAEMLHNLGQALAGQRRFDEAEANYAQSLVLNLQEGALVGCGIVQGLLGDLKAQRQQWDAAEHDLQQALDIARRMDNRWREAWTLLRLAKVHEARGTSDAFELHRAALGLYEELGCRVQ